MSQQWFEVEWDGSRAIVRLDQIAAVMLPATPESRGAYAFITLAASPVQFRATPAQGKLLWNRLAHGPQDYDDRLLVVTKEVIDGDGQ